MNTSSVIDKVQKLLALSKSSNANEAAAAAAAANKLIDQYRLSEADLEIQGQAEEPIEEDGGYIYESGRITPWKSSLAINLAKHYGVYLWNDCHWPSGRMVTRYRLVGRKSDITVCKYMYNWLSLECQRLSDLHTKGRGKVAANSFCLGFVKGVMIQLDASRKDLEQAASSGAMIKINAREDAAKAFAHSLRKLVSRAKSSHSQIDPGAFAAGKSRGENIHLGSSLGGGTPKLLK